MSYIAEGHKLWDIYKRKLIQKSESKEVEDNKWVWKYELNQLLPFYEILGVSNDKMNFFW